MKPLLYLCFTLFTTSLCAQNLIVNGNFEAGSIEPWQGFKNHITTDDIINSRVGNIENGDGSLVQVFNVTSGETYDVLFDYRWVNAGSTNMTVRIKEGISGDDNLAEYLLEQTVNEWLDGSFSFTIPANIDTVRLVFYKTNGNRPLRLDNVSVFDENYTPPSFVDEDTPTDAVPLGVDGEWVLDFSDEFNGNTIDNNKWTVSVSSQSRKPRPNLGVNDWWWVEDNAFLNGEGQLVLRGEKVDFNTMYCGSVESRNLYETTYGYMEAKMKIAETAKGNHTAFWLQGHNMGNVNNSGEDGAEIDIFESAWVSNDTKAVVHFDGYGPDKKNHTIPYDTPGLHSGFHTFGMLWEEGSIRIFYDGEEVTSRNPNKPFPFTTDSNGYPVVPQVDEWLWLSVGASFGDGDFVNQPVGILSDAEVEYVRVYKPSSTLGIDENHNNLELELDIFPNPVREKLNIETKFNEYNLEVFDMTGKLIKAYKNLYAKTIDTSSLETGLYFFKFGYNGDLITKKVIKK